MVDTLLLARRVARAEVLRDLIPTRDCGDSCDCADCAQRDGCDARDFFPEMTAPRPRKPGKDAWSEESRRAAAEARKRKAHKPQGYMPSPFGAPRSKDPTAGERRKERKQAKILAAAQKVARCRETAFTGL